MASAIIGVTRGAFVCAVCPFADMKRDARVCEVCGGTEFRFDPEGVEEIEVEVSANVSPVIPAKISGPPEDCYPEEGGEVGDIEAEVDGKRFILTVIEEGRAEEEIREHSGDDSDDYDPREDCDYV